MKHPLLRASLFTLLFGLAPMAAQAEGGLSAILDGADLGNIDETLLSQGIDQFANDFQNWNVYQVSTEEILGLDAEEDVDPEFLDEVQDGKDEDDASELNTSLGDIDPSSAVASPGDGGNDSQGPNMLDAVNGIMHKDLGQERVLGFLQKHFGHFTAKQAVQLVQGKTVRSRSTGSFRFARAGLNATQGKLFQFRVSSRGLIVKGEGRNAPVMLMANLAGRKGLAVANLRTGKTMTMQARTGKATMRKVRNRAQATKKVRNRSGHLRR